MKSAQSFEDYAADQGFPRASGEPIGRLRFEPRWQAGPPDDGWQAPTEIPLGPEGAEAIAAAVPESAPHVPQSTFTLLAASELQNAEIPPRRWLVPGRIPMKAVTILSGDGASGKTTILLQLCDAVARGADWLGAPIEEKGPAMFVTAEEDHDEVHRRLAAIVQRRGHSFADLRDFHFSCLSGEDSLLCIETQRGSLRPTPLFDKIEATAQSLKPRLIGIEAAADVYGGDENNRGQVRQFIHLLRRLALAADGAVVLIQHPSVTGMAEGQGRSGSTAWRNSARSQLYFASPKRNEDDPDGDLRELRVVKSNYGRSGETVAVRWDQGLFVPAGAQSPIERAAAEMEVEALFLTLLDRTVAQGRGVGPNSGKNYAPKIFEDMPDAGKVKGRAFAQAMERLLSAGKIKVETSGPPSRRTSLLVRA